MSTLTDLGLTAAPVQALFILVLISTLISAALLFVFYLLQAIGIYEMSSAGRLKNPWYGFVPFMSDYATGRLAEQYAGKSGKKVKGLSTAMISLSIAAAALTLISFSVLTVAGIRVIFSADAALAADATLTANDFMPLFVAIVPFAILYLVLIAYKVVLLVCAYRVFAIFDYKNAVAYTVLCVFFSFLLPIFLFAVRRKTPVYSHAERMEQYANLHFGA